MRVRERHVETTTRTSGRTRPGLPADPATRTAQPRAAPRADQPNVPVWRRRLRRTAKILLMTVAPILLLAAVAAGIVYVRLSHGPVSLMAFARQIERGIDASLVGLVAKVDDATVTLSRDGGLEIRLVNLRLTEEDGDLVASAPLAAVELSHSDLLFLRAVPERVFLIEPKLAVSYAEDTGFMLSFSGPDEAHAASNAAGAAKTEGARLPAPGSAAPGAAATPSDFSQRIKKVDLVRVLAESSARARRGEASTSALREIGLRDATVTFDYAGKKTELKVVDASVDLDHRKRSSVISGDAKFESSRGPWVLTFRTEDSERTNQLMLTTSVRDFVPAAIAGMVPQLGLLDMLDLPIAADASFGLSTAGELQVAKLAVELGKGQLRMPSAKGALQVDAGLLNATYDASKKQLTLAPSTVKAGDSHLTLEGSMASVKGEDGKSEWRFGLKAKEGVLAAEEFGVAGIPLEALVAEGRIVPLTGQTQVSRFLVQAGGAEIALDGELLTTGGSAGSRLEGKFSPMPLATLKALWPRAIAPEVREWVGRSVQRGTLKSGTMRHVSGSFLDAAGAGDKGDRLSIALEGADLQILAGKSNLPIEVPRALVRIENSALEVTVPDASIVAAPGRQVPLKGIKFVTLGADGATGELSLRSQAPLAVVMDAVRRENPELFEGGELPLQGLEGKVDSQFKVTVPLSGATAGDQVQVEGKARISDIQSKQHIGSLVLQGGTIDLDVNASGAKASGDLILNGVLAKVDWQHVFDSPDDKQPPFRLTARLDNSDRTQLGLDVNHLVQGDMPVEVTVERGVAPAPARVHVKADLTNADLLFKDIAWKKPAGRAAEVQFDVAKGRTQPLELQNFRISGDNIAVEGWLAVDAENEVREFYFPDFSLNVVSRLEVQGKLGANKVWDIKAKGSTFDGRDLFRSVVSLNQTDDPSLKPRKPAAGVDLVASVDTMIGHSGVSLRGVTLKLSERKEKLTQFEAQGTLDGGKPLAALLKPDASGPRVVFADSTDAGQVFKLVGFYPNIQGGRVRIEVNLDGKGAADKTGILWVDDFRILGDPVVSEVFSSTGSVGSSIDGTPQGQRKVVREVFEFDRMKVPFAAGHGQFVLEDSYLKGPIVGATIRGKVDYTTQRMNLGGTYVPLQGLNSALGGIPLLGDILNGPRGEGIFGITFAIQGPMSQPQVIVNPLSLVAPGIFREIFQVANPKTRVQLRNEGATQAPVEQRVRASSSSVEGSAQRGDAAPAAGAIDGWSSETSGGAATKKQ